MDKNLQIIVAVVSGLFALLGGFFGAWLARYTEYEKWLRKERSSNFAEFVKQLYSVREKAINIIYADDVLEKDRDIKITRLFLGIKSQENIVRLYLKEKDREKFSELIHEIWILLSPTTEQVIRIKNLDKKLSEIQLIFEKTLYS